MFSTDTGVFITTEHHRVALSMQIMLITGRWNSLTPRLLPRISLTASFSNLLPDKLIKLSCFCQPNQFIIVSLRWYSLSCCQLKGDSAALRVKQGTMELSVVLSISGTVLGKVVVGVG
jgi:hypothetical protein